MPDSLTVFGNMIYYCQSLGNYIRLKASYSSISAKCGTWIIHWYVIRQSNDDLPDLYVLGWGQTCYDGWFINTANI